MQWTHVRPTEPGFYYWQNHQLLNISPRAVRLVQVSRYRNRPGFHCTTLSPVGDNMPPVFSCDLGKEPDGRWAGPLPQPRDL
jgi:hypothetical protein